jgi:polyphosphate kinase
MSKGAINAGHPTYYLNRELGSLAFQRRVFDLALDEETPLLERLKFLAIIDNNLDEFFMVRVGGLSMQRHASLPALSIDGKTPAEQLAAIRKEAASLMASMRAHFKDKLSPELKREGIHIYNYDQLSGGQRENADAFFKEVVFPVLTPLAFDPGHPFPHISNLSLSLAVLIKGPDGEKRFARVKVPATLPRLVPIKRSSGGTRKDGTVPHHHYFVWLEQLIAANLKSLFPGMKVLETHPFRVIRNADMAIQQLEADDLLGSMEESVRRRRFGDVVQLAVHPDMPDAMLSLLVKNFRIEANAVYRMSMPLGLSSLMELTRIERFDLKDQPFLPRTVPALRLEDNEDNMFAAIRRQDILLHHPYDSFDPVVNFLRVAARDPDVLAIKQTLYRVGQNSPVVRALLEARRDYGKQVAALVELRARFDEESNIEWAKRLEREGVHVTYGLANLKIHSKLTLVVRKEGERIRRYVHLGTGNYNNSTARVYEDFGLFTADEDFGADASDLFNYLTGYSLQQDYRKLLVAPIGLREQLEQRIEREIEHHRLHKNGRLIFKLNALVDKPMIRLLYRASQAGVQIDLIIRSMCSLRPGIKGLSENIRVRSVLGRFLEHSRVFYFHNNGQGEILLGSADLMSRNLNDRVEVLFPLQDRSLVRFVRDEVLSKYLAMDVDAHFMMPDGRYERLKQKKAKGEQKDLQSLFLLNGAVPEEFAGNQIESPAPKPAKQKS